jgi:heptosyltransferase-2
MPSVVKFDCRFYLGDRPCRFRRACEGCEDYSPMGTRILVVKLAAAGDVLRTTAVLPPLKRKYPDSHITWVTDESAVPLLEHNPYVDVLIPYGVDASLVLPVQTFDVAIGLDKEPRACALVSTVVATEKLGFGLSTWGTTEPLNEGAWYDLELGLSDEKKFHVNDRTYAEIACGVAEVDYEGDPYMLVLPPASIEHANAFAEKLNPAGPLVGLNAGAGRVFANKAWTTPGYGELAGKIAGDLGGTPLVLSGRDDRGRAEEILRLAGGPAVDAGLHELLDFAAIVGTLDALVTGDTLAMHIAVALGVPVVAIFGPTVPQEIELYGGGRKVVTSIDCAPCYRRECDITPTCMDEITTADVFVALEQVLEES